MSFADMLRGIKGRGARAAENTSGRPRSHPEQVIITTGIDGGFIVEENGPSPCYGKWVLASLPDLLRFVEEFYAGQPGMPRGDKEPSCDTCQHLWAIGLSPKTQFYCNNALAGSQIGLVQPRLIGYEIGTKWTPNWCPRRKEGGA